MKKFVVLILICSGVALACHKKAVPEITSRTNFPEAPKSAQMPVDNTPETIAAGKIVFETKCNTCHELKDTKLYSANRWTSILRVMVPRAGLNREQILQLNSYIMANTAK